VDDACICFDHRSSVARLLRPALVRQERPEPLKGNQDAEANGAPTPERVQTELLDAVVTREETAAENSAALVRRTGDVCLTATA
jgi:hypothetical protein